jgi:hypothetical protein
MLMNRPINGYLLRRSFRPPLLVGFPESHEVIHVPQAVGDASGHCRTHAKCTMKFKVAHYRGFDQTHSGRVPSPSISAAII